MTPRHSAALTYARQGIPVFAVCVDDKKPLPLSGGFKDATTDENRIEAWWAELDYNLALEPERAGWCVVDLDGEEGLRTWAELCARHGAPPETMVVQTPGGGQHIYFKGSLPGSVQKLGPKVDTRGRGSYVLVPPSLVAGKPYLTITDAEPAPLPEWIALAVESTAERRTADGEFEMDSDERIALARRKIALELKWNGGTPYEGGGSDNRAYKLAAKLRDIGLSDEMAIEMMEELWAPHFDHEWIEHKVVNAEKFAQNERGSVHVTTAGEIHDRLLQYLAPSPSAAPVAALLGGFATSPDTSYFAQPFGAIKDEPGEVVEWVWQDRLLASRANLYTGDAGAGKTTLAENLAVAVACGVPHFLGAAVKQMPVLLLVGEDAKSQVRDNIAAIAHGLGVSDHPALCSDIFIRSVLTDEPEDGHTLARIDEGEVDFHPFCEELAKFVCEIGRPCLIVIDPLAEFVQFDNLDPVSCRVLATKFCGMLMRFGAGGNTILVNDHPSKAALSSGAHYAGSAQLKAAFALFATLLKGDWSGSDTRQRELTLAVMKARYAAETETKFYRTSISPLFVRDGAPGQTREDITRRVYEFICERLDHDPPLWTGKEKSRGENVDSGKIGRLTVAKSLDLTEIEVGAAMTTLLETKLLVWCGSEGSGRKPARFERLATETRGGDEPAPPSADLAY